MATKKHIAQRTDELRGAEILKRVITKIEAAQMLQVRPTSDEDGGKSLDYEHVDRAILTALSESLGVTDLPPVAVGFVKALATLFITEYLEGITKSGLSWTPEDLVSDCGNRAGAKDGYDLHPLSAVGLKSFSLFNEEKGYRAVHGGEAKGRARPARRKAAGAGVPA